MSAGTFALIGAGAAGRAVSLALHRAGWALTWICDREPAAAAALRDRIDPAIVLWAKPPGVGSEEVVIIAVPDRAIAAVADELARNRPRPHATVYLHLAGALGPTALAPLGGLAAGIGACHPAAALPRDSDEPLPAGVSFALTGDPAALAVAGRLVASCAGRALHLDEAHRPAWHAALALAANGTAALIGEAAAALVEVGLPPSEALSVALTLGRSGLEAVARHGLPKGLTGPVARGDVETVALHLAALRGAPARRQLYLDLARHLVELAATPADADDHRDRLRRLLEK